MARTKVAVEFYLPTGSFSRINDAIEETRGVLEKHKGKDFFITYSGPFPDDTEAKSNDGHEQAGRRSPDVGRSRDRTEAGAEAGDGGEAPAEPAKRGRGRPRKSDAGDGSAEAPRASAGRSDEGERAEGRRAREGSKRDEPRGADEGAEQGRGSGEGRSRGAGRDRDAERGHSEEARVKPADDDWDTAAPDDGPDDNTEEGPDWWCKTPGDDNWPDHLMPEHTDKDSLKEALNEHFEQSGDRTKTLKVLKDATGESALPHVHPDDYGKAIRVLLKDAARTKYGVKR